MSELVEKIRSRLLIDESNGCWIWQGGKAGKGYGSVLVPGEGRTVYTHRAMYEAFKGPIPERMQIDHLCRTPACCNPEHLEAVTPKENTRRGLSPALARARRHRKTHCRNGHEFTADNSYLDSQGRKFCRECKRIWHAKWNELRRTKSLGYRKDTANGGNVVSIGAAKNG